jgi:hypothetical protein
MSLGPGVQLRRGQRRCRRRNADRGKFDDPRRNGLYTHHRALVLMGAQRLAPFGGYSAGDVEL